MLFYRVDGFERFITGNSLLGLEVAETLLTAR